MKEKEYLAKRKAIDEEYEAEMKPILTKSSALEEGYWAKREALEEEYYRTKWEETK